MGCANFMDFTEWLTRKIRETGLSYSELARRGGMSHARISQVMGGETPGADFCVKLARALGESPEYVLRLAGILEPLPEEPPGQTVEDMVRDLWLAQKRKPQVLREQSESYSIPVNDRANPDLEDIINVVERLDGVEQQAVYDYARFRYYEQQHRRNSSRERPMSEEEELLRLVANLSPEGRKDVIQFLLRRRDL